MRAIVLGVLLFASTASAGVVADAFDGMRDGRLRFEYTTRDGVAGDGRSLIVDDGRHADWACDCDEGPARVQIRVRDGEVTDLDVRVGGRWRAPRPDTVDLGTVDAAEAADFLLALAERATGGDVEDAVLGAMIAAGFDDHERLLALARDDDRPRSVRESAIFWLGQAAGERVTAQLTKLVEDDDQELSLREHAIFSLSQRDVDECFEPLSRIATSSRHPQLREKAFFWLAQHDDPRVIALFEAVLVH